MSQLFAPLLSICALLALAGCGQRDEIARYTVPKPELVEEMPFEFDAIRDILLYY